MEDSSIAWLLPIGLHEKYKGDRRVSVLRKESERTKERPTDRPQLSDNLKTCSSVATVISLK